MKLTELIKMFREAREKASQGPWRHAPGDSYCAYPIVINNKRDFIFEDHAGHDCDPKFCEAGEPTDEHDPAFIVIAANHILELTEKAEKMQRALEFYADSAHMINVDYEEFEAIPGNKDFIEQEHGLRARQVLAEAEK